MQTLAYIQLKIVKKEISVNGFDQEQKEFFMFLEFSGLSLAGLCHMV